MSGEPQDGARGEFVIAVDRRVDVVGTDQQGVRLLRRHRDIVGEIFGALELADRLGALADHLPAAQEQHLFGLRWIELHHHAFPVRAFDVGGKEPGCRLIEDRREEVRFGGTGAAIDEIVESGADGVVDVPGPRRQVTAEGEVMLKLIARRIREEEDGGGDGTVDGRIAELVLQVVLLDGERRLEREGTVA